MKTNRLFLLLALLSLLATSAFSQRGFGRMFGGGAMVLRNPGFLLMRDDVKTELNLTDEQKTKLQAIQEEVQGKMRDAFQSGGSDRTAMQAAMQKISEDSSKEINAVLTADQQKRLKQIAYQFAGNAAALDPDTAKAIGITDDQKAKIDDLNTKMQEANTALREKAQSGEIDRSEIGPKMQSNQKALNDAIGGILTDDQKAKLKDLQGPEFKRTDEGG